MRIALRQVFISIAILGYSVHAKERATIPRQEIPRQACRIGIGKAPAFVEFCGGSVISADGILTARHCFFKNGRWTIPAAIWREARISVSCGNGESRTFEKGDLVFDRRVDSIADDAALIRLKKPLHLAPIEIATHVDAIMKLINSGAPCGLFGVGQKNDWESERLGIFVRSRSISYLYYWATAFAPMLVFDPPSISVDSGDSGAMLACRKGRDNWVQIGLLEATNLLTDAVIVNPISNFGMLVAAQSSRATLELATSNEPALLQPVGPFLLTARTRQ